MSPVPDTYFSVESLELAVSSEHKMFPLIEQDFNSEKLQTIEKDQKHLGFICGAWISVYSFINARNKNNML